MAQQNPEHHPQIAKRATRLAGYHHARLIFFYGNAGNISDVAWYGDRLRDRGFDVFLLDYRGFGRSEGESTSEQSIYADAEAAYQYVNRTLGVAPDKIALLFAAANEPRTLKIFPGAGHNVYGTQGNAYLNLLVDFLRLSLKTKSTNRLP